MYGPRFAVGLRVKGDCQDYGLSFIVDSLDFNILAIIGVPTVGYGVRASGQARPG